MTTGVRLTVLILLCVMPSPLASAQQNLTAGDLTKVCQSAAAAVNNKGKWDNKKPEQIYSAGQCEAFLEGWLQGVDGSVYTVDSKAYIVTIKWSDLPKSMFTIADALSKHLSANPLDSGKSVSEVLITILRSSNLLNATEYIQQTGQRATSVQ